MCKIQNGQNKIINEILLSECILGQFFRDFFFQSGVKIFGVNDSNVNPNRTVFKC